MTKIDKLWQRLLKRQGAVRFREFERVLRAFGFTKDRVRGSHIIYTHPNITRPLSVQPRNGVAEPY